jgi:SAM-dependent methyltransferase
MSDSRWGVGYITDAHYADTYVRELSPAWLTYVAALHGVASPPLDRPFTYLELGCGFGQSTTVHAAAFPDAKFYGCDFNPIHIESATEDAGRSGVANVLFSDAAFDRLPAADFPAEFDYIVLHGVYSWVDDATRASIRRVITQRLRRGGLAYVSYNCQPGWSAEVPLRRLLRELAMAANGDTAIRTREAVDRLGAFAALPFRYFKASPAAAEAVDSYARSSHDYLAHEFLNEAWEPFYSLDVANDMAAAGLVYVGSATLPDNHPVLLMDERAAQACDAVPARLRELSLDFATNRRFRRDVFVKDANDHTPRSNLLLEMVVGSVEHPATIETNARVPRGEIHFQPAFIEDLRPLLSEGAQSIRDLVAALSRRGSADPSEIVRNIALLVAAGPLAPFRQRNRLEPRTSAPPAVNTRTRSVLQHIATSGRPRAVAGGALGGGILVTPEDARHAIAWLDGIRAHDPDTAHVATRLLRIGAL